MAPELQQSGVSKFVTYSRIVGISGARTKHQSMEFQSARPLAASDRPSMPAVYAAIARDEPRDNLIPKNVLKASEAKRPDVVLIGRRDNEASSPTP